ncbi:hypothetical protein NliqN6_4322 [Naganishia liquefaciens]|uniref:Uncharacterized protein n=1 Tax=Naganishia liquefaciens TaxID=104408 RepID=A0A8H3TVC0_9TREE|nr:hypothetical protein NliqN6_4322 [Naganishia liquefaciens]
MGVKGLWSLLSPVARPIKLETMEGKRLAIDSSIWLYQFQATMRDKDGRVLVNAHILGFLRRINKLLFHGIKPVFVFDGGAPNLKRSTIAERKRKKTGAAASHAKVAEKLFAAQMRREAVKAAQAVREKQAGRANQPPGVEFEYQPEEGDLIEEGNAAYLDDSVGPQPVRQFEGVDRETGNGAPLVESPVPVQPEPSPAQEMTPAIAAAERRKKFKNHDPYRLPELPEGALTATRSNPSTNGGRPDPRMATEEELVHFIEEMKPEDFDLTSPDFRALPTETQYEIIGDLRVRSRQQSHKRLASMLKAAPTPLDFSKAQIASLSQRNNLTQQLLTVTDTIGSSGLHIPVRVAAERNREYVLVRNSEAEGGGWVLGVRDQGTQDKPIVIEESPKKRPRIRNGVMHRNDSDDEVEAIPKPSPTAVDPELRALRQRQMIEAFTRRHTPQKARKNLTYEEQLGATGRSENQVPLFAPEEDEAEEVARESDDEDMVEVVGETLQNPFDDEAVARNLQEQEYVESASLDEADMSEQRALEASRREAARRRDEEDLALIRALRASKTDARLQFVAGDKEPSIAATKSTASVLGDSDEDDFEEVEVPHMKASLSESPKASPTPPEQGYFDLPLSADHGADQGARDEVPPLDSQDRDLIEAAIRRDLTMQEEGIEKTKSPFRIAEIDDTPKKAVEAKSEDLIMISQTTPISNHVSSKADAVVSVESPQVRVESPRSVTMLDIKPSLTTPEAFVASNQSDIDAEPVLPGFLGKTGRGEEMMREVFENPQHTNKIDQHEQERSQISMNGLLGDYSNASANVPTMTRSTESASMQSPIHQRSPPRNSPSKDPLHQESPMKEINESGNTNFTDSEDDELDDSRSLEWSPSPEPEARQTQTDTFPAPPPGLEEDEGGIDMNAEGDDYARFLASIKHRNLEQVRQEIDNEIRNLNQQNKVAMRDSEEITHQMIAQIQLLLRLFGIPYVTAPMEAEAQCAELARLNLVDGVITDDNDVFLFGASQCFKNLFNDAKYVECFIAADLARELSLTRERLISLAYLLGSDYTEGLPGIGPVAGMEIMANFPGPHGLQNFKAWWTDVQQGRDDVENETKWQKSFKKKFSDSIYLSGDWPNPAVREAYNLPTVDSSDEPFHWGFPDLIGLRGFLQAELSWSVSKVDDELTPIIQRLARRGQVGTASRQTILDPFFDSSLGQGQFAPRTRTKHPSKRLQAVIKAYREAEARANGEAIPKGFGEMLADLNEPEPPLKSITELDGLESEAALNDETSESTRAKQGSKRKGITSNNEDGSVPAKRAPRKRKTVDSMNSDATSAVTAADDSTPNVSRRGSAVRRRGRGRGRGSQRGRSASRASSVVTTTTMANDHDQDDFDDDWGRSIDEAITKEMLEAPTGTTGTDKENSLPAGKVSRPRPRKRQKVVAETAE